MMIPTTTTNSPLVHTIGFTEKSAERFFGLLRQSGAERVVDVRLNNRSQLAAFSKNKDLEFFLRELLGVDYIHIPELAPSKELFSAYRSGDLPWADYAADFLRLLREREVEKRVNPEIINNGCLLCSEHQPHHCHRRLVVEHLAEYWGDLRVRHLA